MCEVPVPSRRAARGRLLSALWGCMSELSEAQIVEAATWICRGEGERGEGQRLLRALVKYNSDVV